jgi:signal transduction histidine kinase
VIYRIVQEGLTNICKHAAATSVQIQIEPTETGLTLLLQDNGKGFPVQQSVTGYGLQGMQERTTAVGGQLEVVSYPGAGCQIIASFPREQPTSDFNFPQHRGRVL